MPVYAGFWKRFAAFLIDRILIVVATFPITFAIGFFVGIRLVASGHGQSTDPTYQDTMTLIRLGSGIFGATVDWLYYALMESSGLQTSVGGLVLGLIVTDMDGNRISFGRATGRFFGRVLVGLTCCIGYVMVAFTEKKQGLHDMVSGTLVVEKNR